MTSKLPVRAQQLASDFPDVWQAYESLGKACAEAGPIGGQTRRLIKLALAIGGGTEGAVHSHVRQALEEGVSPEELRQVALLAGPTLGLPTAVRALAWIEDILN